MQGVAIVHAALFLLTLLTAASPSETSATGAETPRRPNILLVLTDDHYARALGSVNPEVITPNLDRLARAGVRMENSYICFPVCHTARCTLLTGRYPSAHRAWNNRSLLRDYEVTFAEVLLAAGYRTAAIGKMHYEAQGQAQGVQDVWNEDDYYSIMKARDLPAHETWDAPRRFMFEVGVTSLPPSETLSGLITRQALDWLERHASDGQPWLLILSYPIPHAPTSPPEKYARMYDPKKITLPPNAHGYFDESVPWYPGWLADRRFTDAELRLFLARYYALVTQVDEHVGQVLNLLQEENALDETIVLFAGDQGEMAGEHGGVGKGAFFYEAEARFPLIVRYPRLIPPGRVVTSLVSQVDLMPTLLDLADVPIPVPVQGVSQAPVLTGETEAVRDACFGEILQVSKFIRTGDYALTYYRERGGELYDLAVDPRETRNVFDDPAYAVIRKVLMHRLFEWCLEKEDLSTPIAAPRSDRQVEERDRRRQEQKVHHPGLSVEPGANTP